MKFLKKIRKRWQIWRFMQHNPVVGERRSLLSAAVAQGKEIPNHQVRWRKST